METVINENQYQNLKNNNIIGNPKLLKSSINFSGVDNVLYCENGVHIQDSSIRFMGNNSLVYLSSTESKYILNLQIFNDSVIYIGKNNNISSLININIQEHQNLIIGDEGIIGGNSTIRTSDAHPIFNIHSKKRINHSKSVYIGDHVWIGYSSYISKGSEIGSGSILDSNTYVEGNKLLKSNCLYGGNPSKLVKNDVFFTNTYLGNFTSKDSEYIEDYSSRIYFYQHKSDESLSPEKLDEIFKKLSVDEKIEFIQKLFVANKKHNRFSI